MSKREISNTARSKAIQAKKRKKRVRRQQRRLLIAGIVALVCLLIYGMVMFNSYRYVKKVSDKKISDNIYFGTVDLSGMTKEEAKEAVDAHVSQLGNTKVTFQVEDSQAEAALSELGFSYDGKVEKLVKEAFDYGKTGKLRARYKKLRKLEKTKQVYSEKYVVDKELTKAVLEEKVNPLTEPAQNAKLKKKKKDGFEIIDGKNGKAADIDNTIKMIHEKIAEGWGHKGFSVDVPLVDESPKVKAEDLKDIKDELGSFSTDAGGGSRWKNLVAGVGKINGTVLAPGEELSVHDVTAPYDAEHGYVAAGSYENGKVVDTYGGGICQVSTTLYNAVLYAELEVVKRFPHSMLVAYVDPSRDAAIAGDTKDFVFKNNYENPIYIEGEITADNQLTFRIYGKETRSENRSVEYESETTATEEYKVIYQDDPTLPAGQKEYEGSPHNGKSARLWKIVKENGKEVSREVINQSEYRRSDEIIRVGTKE